MTWPTRSAGVCAALTLSACMVGPNFKAPTPPLGAISPLVSFNPTAESAGQPPDDWWRLYSDPRLDRYIHEAFTANYDLAAAQANLSEARAVLEAARAGRYPSTVAEAGAVYGRDATTDEILGIVGAPNQTIWKFDDVLDVSYELDLFGRVRRSIRASKADAEATAAARDDLRITIAAETARAYAEICTLGEQIDVAHRSYDIVEREAAITAGQQDAGAGSQYNTLRARGLAAQVRASIAPLEGQRRSAYFELAALLGKTPSYAPAEALSCVTAPRLPGLIPIGDGAGLLRRRPDIREADRRLAAATERVGVATADLYPRISLTGAYGGAGGSPNSLISERGLIWGAGPAISWDFPIQATPRARIHAAKASAQGALDTFDSTVLRALKETEQALATYSAELDHRQALADAQDNERRAFDAARSGLDAGAVSSLDLLTTEQSLVAADAAVAASDTALAQDQIAVFKALGGGWGGQAKIADAK